MRAADKKSDHHRGSCVLDAAEESHGRKKYKSKWSASDINAKVGDSLVDYRRSGTHQGVKRGYKEQTCAGDCHASEQREEEGSKISLATGPEILCAVVIAYQCRRAEAQKGENPVDSTDDRCA